MCGRSSVEGERVVRMPEWRVLVYHVGEGGASTAASSKIHVLWTLPVGVSVWRWMLEVSSCDCRESPQASISSNMTRCHTKFKIRTPAAGSTRELKYIPLHLADIVGTVAPAITMCSDGGNIMGIVRVCGAPSYLLGWVPGACHSREGPLAVALDGSVMRAHYPLAVDFYEVGALGRHITTLPLSMSPGAVLVWIGIAPRSKIVVTVDSVGVVRISDSLAMALGKVSVARESGAGSGLLMPRWNLSPHGAATGARMGTGGGFGSAVHWMIVSTSLWLTRHRAFADDLRTDVDIVNVDNEDGQDGEGAAGARVSGVLATEYS